MLVTLNGMGFIQSNGGQLILIDSSHLPGTLIRLFGEGVSFTSHKTGNQIKICKTLSVYIVVPISLARKGQVSCSQPAPTASEPTTQACLTISGNYC